MSGLPSSQTSTNPSGQKVIDQRLVLLRRHWQNEPWSEHLKSSQQERRQEATIAISREVGANGSEVARQIGKRLDWPVYDREILDMIAQRSVLRSELLESIDEHDRSWLAQTLSSFAHPGEMSSAGYFHHLTHVLAALGKHGKCVIVGRAATAILPEATTFRVRIIAPFEQRVHKIAQQRHLSYQDARKYTHDVDTERTRFISSHFQQDTNDAHGFDLVLNTARFTPMDCAELVVAAVKVHQFHPELSK